MTLQITNDKAKEWVKKGAPTHGLEFLGDTVKSMSDFAEQNDILHKDEDVVAEEVTESATEQKVSQDGVPKKKVDDPEMGSVDPSTETTGEQNTHNTNAEEEPTNESTETTTDNSADFMSAFGKSLTDSIAVAIKTYHDEVVVPLQKSIEALENPTKEVTNTGFTNKMFEGFLGDDWMPASVMANTIKEQVAATVTTEGDETVSDEEVAASATEVDKALTNDNSMNPNYVEGHLFNEL